MEIERLGPYKIERMLGRGGMGTVYAAVEESTGKPAAIKVLAPQLAAHEGFRERFEAEIESLKKLEHPNIVRLFGYGQDGIYLYFAMELVDGTSLEDEIANGRRFTWREAAQIGIELCRALKLAHDHGIIHRDIKPANLLMTKDGQVKLTDFGIARLFGNAGVTAEGGVLGTAEFMAPEQADGRPVTHHCDLYSLGGVLYALLAGRAPFRSKSMLDLLQMQKFSRPESVRRYAPETPAEMDQIISQLLEKDPNDRFPNALLLSRRLEAMLRALSLRDARQHDEPEVASRPTPPAPVGADDGFVMGRETVDADAAPGARPIVATMDVVGFGVMPGPTRAAGEIHKQGSSAATQTDDDLEPQGAAGVNAGTSTFTTIDEDRRRAATTRHPEPLLSVPTLFLIAGLVAVAAVVWVMLQPPSADSLYERIDAAEQAEDEQRLLDVDDDVKKFLHYYRSDPRAHDVRDVEDAISDIRMHRGATVEIKSLARRYRDSPTGQEFLAAIELSKIDPEQARDRLRSLIDMFEGLEDNDGVTFKFVKAAREQLPYLESQVDKIIQKKRDLVSARLTYAAQNADPEQAKRICEAVIKLYVGKDWANDLVAQAREILDETGDSREAKPGAGTNPQFKTNQESDRSG